MGEYTRREVADKTRVLGGAMVITHSVSARNGTAERIRIQMVFVDKSSHFRF